MTRDIPTTSSSSGRAVPACAPRSRPPTAGVSVGLICKSLLGKAHTVMAEGGMAAAHGPQRRPRQLAGAFRRHHARRSVRQQLAHGGNPRQGSARSRARARGLGRGVRSHEGRPDQPAQLRRPPVSAAGARRRPHRPRADSRAAGPHDLPGRDRPHGVHGRRPRSRRGPRGGRPRLRPPERRASTCSRRRRLSWPPAASDAPTR